MADSRSISGAVNVQQDSKERVAFDLMSRISHLEGGSVTKNRRYYLELFSQCREIVHGSSVEHLSVKLKDQ